MKPDLLSLLLWTLMTAYHWETFCLGLGERVEDKSSLHGLKCTEKCSNKTPSAAAPGPTCAAGWEQGRPRRRAKALGIVRGSLLLQGNDNTGLGVEGSEIETCRYIQIHAGNLNLPTSGLDSNRFTSCCLSWNIKQADKHPSYLLSHWKAKKIKIRAVYVRSQVF